MTSDKAPTPSPDASPESRTDVMTDAAPETARAGKPDDTSAAAGTPEQAEQTGPGGQDAVAGQPEAAATPNDAHADKSNGGHVPSRAEKQAAPVPPAGRAEKFFQTLCCLGPWSCWQCWRPRPGRISGRAGGATPCIVRQRPGTSRYSCTRSRTGNGSLPERA